MSLTVLIPNQNIRSEGLPYEQCKKKLDDSCVPPNLPFNITKKTNDLNNTAAWAGDGSSIPFHVTANTFLDFVQASEGCNTTKSYLSSPYGGNSHAGG